MPRPSENPNYAYEAEECPILYAWPEFWWMSDVEKSNFIEARALAYGGTGYRYHPEREREW
jgi:hypothetical protein